MRQPDTSRLPVLDAYFDAPSSFSQSRFSTTDDAHVSTAVGNDRVYVSSEQNGRVAVYNATSLAYVSTLSASGLTRPRGVTFYRNQVFVADSDDNQIWVFDAASGAALRHFDHPTTLLMQSGAAAATAIDNIHITGVDAAWGEVWTSFESADAGTGITVFDATTGTVRAVMWQLPTYNCHINPLRLQNSSGQLLQQNCAVAPEDTTSGVVVQCTPVSIMDNGGGAFFNPRLTLDTEQCSAAVDDASANSLGFHWWDIATSPDVDGVIAQCRFINRGPLLTQAASADVLSTASPLDSTDCASAYPRVDGIDAVWGMRWMLMVEGQSEDVSSDVTGSGQSGALNNGQVEEFAIQPVGAGQSRLVGPMRRWETSSGMSHRDTSYQNREVRIDWKGDLTRQDWMRGTRCVNYIVSDADIYVVGARGQRFYELARGFGSIQMYLDGSPLGAASTSPNGTLCFDTNTVRSGPHKFELRATVDNGSRTVTRTNDALRLDHDAPTGRVDSLPAFVRGTVSLTGAMSDPHSGPRDFQFQAAPSGAGYGDFCGLQDGTGGQTFSCSWDTTRGANGRHDLRGSMRDQVATAFGGPNLGTTPVVATTVDNAPPSLSVGNELKASEDLRPLEYGEPVRLDVQASDGISGVTHVEVQVDGVQRTVRDQGCGGGGCALNFAWDLLPEDYVDGSHTVRVVAADQVGNQTEQSWTIDVEAPPAPDNGEEDAALGDNDTGAGTATSSRAQTAAGFATLTAADPALAGNLAQSILPCTRPTDPANFGVFSLGQSFEGMAATAVLRRCDVPFPGEPVRGNFVSYIYGDCTVDDLHHTGCAPPLEVQSWPACERSIADYAYGPELGLPDHSTLTVRSVPAALFEDGLRLEVYTGDSTVVIFGKDAAQVRRAGDTIAKIPAQQPVNTTPNWLVATASPLLPQPVRGAVNGLLPCVS